MADERTTALIKRAIAGDVTAFEKLVKEHKQGLYSFALGMSGGDHASASDVLQEALLKAFLNIGKFRGDCSFMTWLWRITRNEFVDYRTSPKTSGNLPLDDIPEKDLTRSRSFDETIAEDQRREHLHRLIGMLSDEHREAIALVDLQELRYDEAAAMLGISESAFKSRLFRARENLFKLALEHKKFFT